MAKRKYLNLIIAPEDRSSTLNFRLSLPFLYTATIAASVIFIGVVVLILNQAMDEVKLGELELLKHQNQQLKEKLAEIDKIAEKIDEIEVIEDKLMVMAGEREAERELEAVTVGEETESFGKTALTLPDGLREYHGYVAEHRGAELMAPIGEPVSGGWLSRGFGERVSLGPKGFHPGIDIAIPEGTDVRATAPGVVIFAGNDPIYGNLVIIEHGLTGYTTFYGHNKQLKVKVGDIVKRGGVIAISGNTGESSAPHLHYEVRLHGVPVNPLKYIKRPGEVIFTDFTPATPEIVPAEETKITEEKAEPEKETPPSGETGRETTTPNDDGGAIPESGTRPTETDDGSGG
jgi:hypothetical protein